MNIVWIIWWSYDIRDECGLNFLAFILKVGKTQEKPQPGNWTDRGSNPDPLDHCGGLQQCCWTYSTRDLYNGCEKSNGRVRYFWRGTIQRGNTCTVCTFNIVAPFIYLLLPNVWKASYTMRASILLMLYINYPITRIRSCLMFYRVPRSGSFTLVKRS